MLEEVPSFQELDVVVHFPPSNIIYLIELVKWPANRLLISPLLGHANRLKGYVD